MHARRPEESSFGQRVERVERRGALKEEGDFNDLDNDRNYKPRVNNVTRA